MGKRKSGKNLQFPLLPLVGGIVPPFGATFANIVFAPFPYGFLLELLIPSPQPPLSVFRWVGMERGFSLAFLSPLVAPNCSSENAATSEPKRHQGAFMVKCGLYNITAISKPKRSEAVA